MFYQSHCLLFRKRHVLRTNHSEILCLAESHLTGYADLIHLCLFEKLYFMVGINTYIYTSCITDAYTNYYTAPLCTLIIYGGLKAC